MKGGADDDSCSKCSPKPVTSNIEDPLNLVDVNIYDNSFTFEKIGTGSTSSPAVSNKTIKCLPDPVSDECTIADITCGKISWGKMKGKPIKVYKYRFNKDALENHFKNEVEGSASTTSPTPNYLKDVFTFEGEYDSRNIETDIKRENFAVFKEYEPIFKKEEDFISSINNAFNNKIVGITNLGSSCYANTSIQNLTNTPIIAHSFIQYINYYLDIIYTNKKLINNNIFNDIALNYVNNNNINWIEKYIKYMFKYTYNIKSDDLPDLMSSNIKYVSDGTLGNRISDILKVSTDNLVEARRDGIQSLSNIIGLCHGDNEDSIEFEEMFIKILIHCLSIKNNYIIDFMFYQLIKSKLGFDDLCENTIYGLISDISESVDNQLKYTENILFKRIFKHRLLHTRYYKTSPPEESITCNVANNHLIPYEIWSNYNNLQDIIKITPLQVNPYDDNANYNFNKDEPFFYKIMKIFLNRIIGYNIYTGQVNKSNKLIHLSESIKYKDAIYKLSSISINTSFSHWTNCSRLYRIYKINDPIKSFESTVDKNWIWYDDFKVYYVSFENHIQNNNAMNEKDKSKINANTHGCLFTFVKVDQTEIISGQERYFHKLDHNLCYEFL
tara:strand:+ start:1441 stop:3276 length:1836 start_codon:yes stop_codon:yes gene_type:complete